MYLLEVTGEKAFELMADLIDPLGELAQDNKFVRCLQTKQIGKAVKFALKDHSKTMLEVMALCNNVPVEDYKKTLPEIVKDVMVVVNNPLIADLFTSQVQKPDKTSSGPATENIEEKGK